MKPSTLLNLVLAAALVIVCGKMAAGSMNKNDKKDMEKEAQQTSGGDFTKFDVMTDFKDNAFNFFATPLLLMAGDKSGSNAMTIGWGSAGNLWGLGRPTITVYVASGRYTHQFMEKTKYFTVMKIDDKVLEYMGNHSGRDGDKTKALGLHIAYTEHGAPYYTEATEVYECEMMYAAPFDERGFRNSVPKDFYANFKAGIHSIYIGEVTGAWKK